jgi:hypothetical protein
MLLVTACIAVVGACAVAAILLFSPVSIVVDSRARQLRVRWLGLVEYRQPLPGSQDVKSFTVAGRPVRGNPSRVSKPSRSSGPRTTKNQRVTRFIRRSLADSVIRQTIARQIARFAQGALRSFSVKRCLSSISLPDPAWNGILTGMLSATNFGRACGVQVNFRGNNELLFELSFYPYRLARTALLFSTGLPYRAMFRAWRASPVRPR